MISTVSLENIPTVKKLLLDWEKKHSDELHSFFQGQCTGQDMRLPDSFLQGAELKLYRLKVKTCDVCHATDSYKFIRTSEIVGKDKYAVFVLCE
jgi:hypothetical protein